MPPKNKEEDLHSEIFANWLKMNDLELSGHIPNETPVGHFENNSEGNRVWKRHFSTLARNKKVGVKTGIPDFIIGIPKELCIEDRDIILFVEMKLPTGKPSDVKEDQKKWLEFLAKVEDVDTFVAFGSKPAMNYVAQFLKNPKMFNF